MTAAAASTPAFVGRAASLVSRFIGFLESKICPRDPVGNPVFEMQRARDGSLSHGLSKRYWFQNQPGQNPYFRCFKWIFAVVVAFWLRQYGRAMKYLEYKSGVSSCLRVGSHVCRAIFKFTPQGEVRNLSDETTKVSKQQPVVVTYDTELWHDSKVYPGVTCMNTLETVLPKAYGKEQLVVKDNTNRWAESLSSLPLPSTVKPYVIVGSERIINTVRANYQHIKLRMEQDFPYNPMAGYGPMVIGLVMCRYLIPMFSWVLWLQFTQLIYGMLNHCKYRLAQSSLVSRQ